MASEHDLYITTWPCDRVAAIEAKLSSLACYTFEYITRGTLPKMMFGHHSQSRGIPV